MREKKMRTKLLKLLRTAPYTEGMVSFETLVDHLIANGVTIQKWIPVTERLPEHGDVCLVYTRYEDVRILQWDAVSKWWLSNSSAFDCRTDEVSHWMPLPEAPKEGDDVH